MKITIGQTEQHKAVSFDLDLLLTTRLLIQANSGAGKSYLLRRLAEQLFPHVQVIIIDPEGEFATLREKYGFVLVGKGGETSADPRIAANVAEKLLELRASAVCDIYELKPSEQHLWVERFLDALVYAPKKLWHPAIVIVDEAHMFCPEKGAGESPAKEAMISLTTKGRKRGFCAVWATQRLAKVDKDATSSLLNRLVGGTFEDVDIKRALDLLSVVPEDKHAVAQQLKTIDPGWFYAFGRAVTKERVLFKVGAIETSHPKPGSSKHAAEPPPAPSEIAKLLPSLADLPKQAEEKARTLTEFKSEIRSLKAQLAARPKELVVAKVDARALRAQATVMAEAAVRARDEEWMRSVLSYQKQLIDTTRKFEEAAAAIRFKAPAAARVLPANSGKEPATLRPNRAVLPAAAPISESHTRESYTRKPYSAAENNGDIPPSRLNILGALAQFEAIGRTDVPKKWVAALAGVSYKSSGYTNNLGALRSAGLIDYPASGSAALTEEGRKHAPEVEAPTNADEMFARCLAIVTPSQAAILKALREVHPEAVAKDELAEKAGVSAASSGYTNNLGALRSAGMIDYPQQGMARLSDWTVLE